MRNETKTIANIVVGRPDVEPTASSHVRGVHEGNSPRRHRGDGAARRSTGINANDRKPIDPRMPNLGPA